MIEPCWENLCDVDTMADLPQEFHIHCDNVCSEIR